MVTDTQANHPHLHVAILNVHQDLSIGKQIHSLLAQQGYARITTVGGAREALSILKVRAVDVLICDADLDVLDGWRLSRLVRSGALKCDAAIPIIITTQTWCERIAEVTAREHGINQLLPVNDLGSLPTVLFQCLEKNLFLGKPRLLVVEDDPDTADIITRILAHRFEIDVAAAGDAGLQAWLRKRHDLVLLDVMLPKLAGPDVLKAIVKHSPNQPVVIMTAHATADQAENLLVSGAADFITKPFRAEPLRAVAEIALRRDDYLVSNKQFARYVNNLADREKAYRSISEKHEHLLNNLQTVVLELDEKLQIIFANDAWKNLMSYTHDETLGYAFKHFLAIKDGRKHRALEGRFRAVLAGNKPTCELQVGLEDKHKKRHWAELRVSASRIDGQSPTLTICLNDITKRKFAQEQLEYLAMHDSLTGLFNRHYFETTLERWCIDMQAQQQLHGLVYIDLDYFKVINDTFGHHKGDEVLREVSQLIKTCIRGSDILCRIGGDEFAILLHSISVEQIKRIAAKVQAVVSDYSFQSGNRVVDIGCSIGISVVDGSSETAEEYLMKADIALYVAKRRGRNIVHFYNPEDSESDELRDNVDWVRKVRQAINDDRLVIFGQPIMDIAHKSVAYYEILIRLLDTDGELIMPDQFIPALEATGDMVALDRWVIRRSMSLLKDNRQLQKIAINLSAQTYKDDSLVPMIRESLDAYNVQAESIIFELTESASLFNINATRRVIDQLHALGCSFAVDDFGSGFSSFAYLKELPADYVKLDGSFIRNLHRDKVDQALVRSIIEVVQALGRKTVAEFVENEKILAFLAENGVDYAQGYYTGKPVPATELLSLIPYSKLA
ncbi:MAG: EAL domain-containing protein [Cellvibrionaceae bacterium]|nr:EAL domain-containing protein [Cellvibrionaceae bacterium]